MLFNRFFKKLVCFMLLYNMIYSADNPLGRDYAFMFLMTMTPNFAAASYTIDSDVEIDVSIGRLPFAFTLLQSDHSILRLEAEYAYHSTQANFPIFPGPGEYVESEWNTWGLGLGLLYDYGIAGNMLLRPSFRYAYGNLANDAKYHGSQTQQVADQLDGAFLFNWETDVNLYNLGLGWTYLWEMLDRTSNSRVDFNRIYMDSFNEESENVAFSEAANMLAFRTDVVFPTGLELSGEDLNLILLLGSNVFVGENRNTLGYTESYQAGLATWIPVSISNKKLLNIFLGAQTLWADKMDGFMILFDFSLD